MNSKTSLSLRTASSATFYAMPCHICSFTPLTIKRCLPHSWKLLALVGQLHTFLQGCFLICVIPATTLHCKNTQTQKLHVNWLTGTRTWLSLLSKRCTDCHNLALIRYLPKQIPGTVYEVIWAGSHSQWQYAFTHHGLKGEFNMKDWSFCAARLRARGYFCAHIMY